MATKSTGNGAKTAQAWKTAAASAQASIKQADAAAYIAQGDLETATAFRDSYYKIANQKNADGTYKYNDAQRAQANKDLATAQQEVVQAKAALSNAAAQRTNAENAYNEATGKSAKNTDPQAASTSLPATTNPGQLATAYNVNPPNANVSIAANSVVSTSDTAASNIAAFSANAGTGVRKRYITDEDGVTTLVSVDGVPVGNTTPITNEPTAITDRGAYIPINAQKPGEDQLSITAANTSVQPQKVVDEFDGIDAQVAENQLLADEAAIRNDAQNTQSGLTLALTDTQAQASRQDQANFNAKKDWRVRLSLAGGADYLYKAEDPGILGPLVATNGVIFPYTPAISVAYAAQYDPTTLTHTNYKFYTYNSSSVDQITLSCDFTAQDVFEANYLLAVIHFFRSITKMFYGQDQNPKNGTPPPLCYLYGLGAFQFDTHPLAVTNFTYTLPTDVDYIRAGEISAPKAPSATYSTGQISKTRLQNLQPGAGVAPPQFSGAYRVLEPTYVPTKIQISITAVPIMTRNMVSNDFSLKQYATGQLIKGAHTGSGGGFW